LKKNKEKEKKKMKITKFVAWSGYVGGPTMAVIAKTTYKLQSLT
jgi:hypothetical protein